MRILVTHAYYGCDTGCCGHVIEWYNEAGQQVPGPGCASLRGEFYFAHPHGPEKQDFRAFAEDLLREEFGEEHLKDLDWEHCVVVDD